MEVIASVTNMISCITQVTLKCMPGFILRRVRCCVMTCKCYCNARSDTGLGHGDGELLKES